MLNLLSAGFVRLTKSRLFWLLIAAETAWSAFLAWLLYYYGNIKENLYLSIFMPMFYLCVAEAVLCGFYIGTDYSDGTVRNKIAVGKTRESIYLSNLMICCLAGLAALFTHLAVFFGAGYLLVGPAISPQISILKYLCAAANVAVYAALFTLISTLCSKMATAATANIFISLGLIVSGIYAYAFYAQPEFFADGSSNHRYVGGAARMAGLDEMPVYIRELDDDRAAQLALVENLQREDLNPIEEALGYKSLMDSAGCTQDDVARVVGKSRSAVANSLRLLSLDKKTIESVRKGDISAGHARALVGITDKDLLESLSQKIKRGELTVRQTEELAKTAPKKQQPKQPKLRESIYHEVELSLRETSGRVCTVKENKTGGGVFSVEFYDRDDLMRIARLLESVGKNDG